MPSFDRAVGIDLGTTNSEIAWLPADEREVVLYADRFGRRTIPSAVAWDAASDRFVVGHAARAQRGTEHLPIESIKRKMGRNEAVALGPHTLDPATISSKIIGELASRMRETLEKGTYGVGLTRPVTRAVITVPAYFDAPQVEATRHAGELAGLEIIGILQEPTAAAIYHAWKRRLGDGVFLIYDLGGGTFDVSIVRCLGGEYQVLAVDGDNFLGGDDFDRRFAEHLRKELTAKGYALDLDVRDVPEDRAIFGAIVHLAQEIKEALTTCEVVSVNKTAFMKDKRGEPVSLSAEIGRSDYEARISDLVQSTLACAERALVHAREVSGIGPGDIDHVVLVGGSTRVPLVVRKVTEALCKDGRLPLQDDVDTCVALGAAIHAATLGGTILADGEARVRISSPLVARSSSLRVGLTVEKAPDRATHLTIWDEEQALAEAEITPGALRLEVELGGRDELCATLALQSAEGVPLAELPLPLARGDRRPRPTALSRASVVAKDISVEITRAGRRERMVLLARGVGLPAQASQVLFTADQSGVVVLRLLQGRVPIKTLAIDVPIALPVGTPVEVVIRCDDAMRMRAHATVGLQSVDAHIEPPRFAEVDVDDVDTLLEHAEGARLRLWGEVGHAFGREADALVAQIREVVHTDPDKLRALCERLRHLIEDFQGSADDPLAPPLARMEEAFDRLRRVVYRAGGPVMGMDRVAWDLRIDNLYDSAMVARDAGDGSAWRRVYNEAQALWETAFQEEFATLRFDEPAQLRRRRASVVYRAEALDRYLHEFVFSVTDEVAVLQRRDRGRIQARLEEAIKAPLREVGEQAEVAAQLRLFDAAEAELDRLEAAAERIGSLGLVTGRGLR